MIVVNILLVIIISITFHFNKRMKKKIYKNVHCVLRIFREKKQFVLVGKVNHILTKPINNLRS